MWLALIIAMIVTILIFSVGKNKKESPFSKENKNVTEDPGSDGNSSDDD